MLNGRVTKAPPAVAGRRVSSVDGRTKSREMAGRDVSVEEKDVPVADPMDENEPLLAALKLNG